MKSNNSSKKQNSILHSTKRKLLKKSALRKQRFIFRACAQSVVQTLSDVTLRLAAALHWNAAVFAKLSSKVKANPEHCSQLWVATCNYENEFQRPTFKSPLHLHPFRFCPFSSVHALNEGHFDLLLRSSWNWQDLGPGCHHPLHP